MSLSDWFRKQLELDAESLIDLGTQERIIFATGRHYIVLLRRLVIPVSGLVIFGGLALYRALGGGLFIPNGGLTNSFDFVNWVLVALIGLLLVVFFVLARGNRAQQNLPLLALVAFPIMLFGGLIYYRASVGQIFGPAAMPDQGLDGVNILLLILACFFFGGILYTIYDWLNDELVVTNQRVVYENDQVIIPRLLEQRVQQQIFLEDVQNVVTSTKTYLQHWFGYGTIEVTSARFQGNIKFEAARDPRAMQDAIMGQVRALRKSQSEKNYGRLVGERVYGLKAPGARPAMTISTTRGWRWLQQIVPANPEINEATGQFTWRRHWLFLAGALVWPAGLLLLCLAILAVGLAMGALNLLALLGVLVVALVALGWSAWQVEDYRNDLYILTPDKVIDIEKKPFGPENRREANLSQVNNISSQTTYLSNLLGYGDVVLSTAGGGGSFTFTQVPRPEEVVGQITEYNVQAKREAANRALNDTLELLKYYHEAQLQRDEINRPQL